MVPHWGRLCPIFCLHPEGTALPTVSGRSRAVATFPNTQEHAAARVNGVEMQKPLPRVVLGASLLLLTSYAVWGVVEKDEFLNDILLSLKYLLST